MSGFRKNVAGQRWRVFAFDRTDNTPVTGDAANITAKIAIDDGTATATNDTNPTETEDGFYLFDLTQAETNGDKLSLYPESSTADVQVVGSPADVFTVPDNFQEAGISAGGVVDGTLNEILGTALTEVTGGRIAGNFDTFFENNDAASSKVQDDVGSATLQLPQAFVANSEQLNAGTISSGDFTDTQQTFAEDGSFVGLTSVPDYELVFNIGTGIDPAEVVTDIRSSTNGGRTSFWQIRNFNLAQWDTLDTVPDTSGAFIRYVHRVFPSGTPGDYVDGSGEVRYRYVSNNLQAGNTVDVGFAEVSAVTDQGSIPTTTEIALAVETLQAGIHGSGPWEGATLFITAIDTVNSQTEFTIQNGPTDDDALNSFYIKLTDLSDPTVVSIRQVTDYVGATKTVTLESAPSFTIATGDQFSTLSIFDAADVQNWNGQPVNNLIGGRVDADVGGIIASNAAAIALEDFVTDGYDSGTNQINGVKLVDTTTTNTDMRGTDGAATPQTVWDFDLTGTAAGANRGGNQLLAKSEPGDQMDLIADAVDSGTVSASGGNKIADHTLRRAWSNAATSSDGDAKAFRSLLGAVAKLVNRMRSNAGTLEIYEDDDSTILGSQTLTADSAADPITEVDTV